MLTVGEPSPSGVCSHGPSPPPAKLAGVVSVDNLGGINCNQAGKSNIDALSSETIGACEFSITGSDPVLTDQSDSLVWRPQHLSGRGLPCTNRQLKLLNSLVSAEGGDPEFALPPVSLRVVEGDVAEFSCRVAGTQPIGEEGFGWLLKVLSVFGCMFNIAGMWVLVIDVALIHYLFFLLRR